MHTCTPAKQPTTYKNLEDYRIAWIRSQNPYIQKMVGTAQPAESQPRKHLLKKRVVIGWFCVSEVCARAQMQSRLAQFYASIFKHVSVKLGWPWCGRGMQVMGMS